VGRRGEDARTEEDSLGDVMQSLSSQWSSDFSSKHSEFLPPVLCDLEDKSGNCLFLS
jgi:hypothetical protein